MNVFEKMQLKFTSSNDVPVQRAQITSEEWEDIKMFFIGKKVLLESVAQGGVAQGVEERRYQQTYANYLLGKINGH